MGGCVCVCVCVCVGGGVNGHSTPNFFLEMFKMFDKHYPKT